MFNLSSSVSRITPYVINLPQGTVDFFAITLNGYVPLTVQFFDISIVPNITEWRWDFTSSGTTQSTDQNPTWVFDQPGVYNISLTVVGESVLSTTKLNYITVFSVDFDGTPVVGITPLTVQFLDLSNGFPTSWEWDFDNSGNTDSAVQNPSHTYVTPGTYDVKLTVANDNLQSGTVIKSQYITVLPPAEDDPASILIMNDMSCDTLYFASTDSDSNGNIYVLGNKNIGSSTGNYYGNTFLVKFDSQLRRQWQIDFEALDTSIPISLAVDKNTNVIHVVIGYYIDIIPKQFAVVISIDSSGVILNQKEFNSDVVGYEGIINSISVDNYGNVYISGLLNNEPAGYNIVPYIEKLTSDMNCIWKVVNDNIYPTIGAGVTSFHATDSAQNTYFVYSNRAAEFEIVKISSGGTVLIKKKLYYSSVELGNNFSLDLSINSNNDIFISGNIVTIISDNIVRGDILVCLDTELNIQWQKIYGSDSSSILLDNLHGIVSDSTGVYITTTVIDSYPTNGSTNPSYYYCVHALVKIDLSGNIEWQRYLDEFNNNHTGKFIDFWPYTVPDTIYNNKKITLNGQNFVSIAQYHDYTASGCEKSSGLIATLPKDGTGTGTYNSAEFNYFSALPYDPTFDSGVVLQIQPSSLNYVSSPCEDGLLSTNWISIFDTTTTELLEYAGHGLAVIDNDMNVVVAGSAQKADPDYSPYQAKIFKTDVFGRLLYNKTIKLINEFVTSTRTIPLFSTWLQIDSSSNSYVSITCESVFVSPTYYWKPSCMVKINSSGEVQWLKLISYINDIVPTGASDPVVGINSFVLDNSANLYVSVGKSILKLDSSGNYAWELCWKANPMGGENRSLIYYQDNLYFIASDQVYLSTFGSKFFKIDSNKNIVYCKQFVINGSSTQTLNDAASAYVDSSGTIFVINGSNINQISILELNSSSGEVLSYKNVILPTSTYCSSSVLYNDYIYLLIENDDSFGIIKLSNTYSVSWIKYVRRPNSFLYANYFFAPGNLTIKNEYVSWSMVSTDPIDSMSQNLFFKFSVDNFPADGEYDIFTISSGQPSDVTFTDITSTISVIDANFVDNIPGIYEVRNNNIYEIQDTTDAGITYITYLT